MDILRASTADAHRFAESQPLMRALARSTLAPAGFIANLEQLLLVHRALERRLDSLDDPRLARIAADRRRVPDLEADLIAFGGSPAPAPLPPTREAIATIDQATALELIGMLYVTEGSTNGGRFLVKCAAKVLGLTPGSRIRSLDPYGDAQPAQWAAFKLTVNESGFGPDENERLVAGALAMFGSVTAIAAAIEPSDGSVAQRPTMMPS